MLTFAQVGGCLGLLLFNAPAVASEIHWRGAAGCLREQELTEQVEAAIGRPLRAIDGLDFEVDVEPEGDATWSLRLVTVRRRDAARSQRQLRGSSCVEVTDAAAVAIALAIGPKPADASETPPPAPAPPVATRPRLEPPDLRAPAPASASLSPPPLEWTLGLSGALDAAATPKLAPGAALRVGLSRPPSRQSPLRLRFELEGALFAPTQTPSVGGTAGRFQLGYVAPLVCGIAPAGQSAVLACVGYEIGQLRGEGVGSALSESHQRQTWWYAARAELGVLVPLSSLVRLSLRGGAALAFSRREFVLDGPGVVFRPALLSFRAQFGLELPF